MTLGVFVQSIIVYLVYSALLDAMYVNLPQHLLQYLLVKALHCNGLGKVLQYIAK